MTICNTTHSVKRSIPQALRCLEGTTLSNRGHRPRIKPIRSLCLKSRANERRAKLA